MPNCITFDELAKKIAEQHKKSSIKNSLNLVVTHIITTIISGLHNDVELGKRFKNCVLQFMPTNLAIKKLEINQNNSEIIEFFILNEFIAKYLSQDIKTLFNNIWADDIRSYLQTNPQANHQLSGFYINALLDWISGCLTHQQMISFEKMQGITLKIQLQKPLFKSEQIIAAVKEIIAKEVVFSLSLFVNNECLLAYDEQHGLSEFNSAMFALSAADIEAINYFRKLISYDKLLNNQFRNYYSSSVLDFKERINSTISHYFYNRLYGKGDCREFDYENGEMKFCEFGRYGSSAFLNILNREITEQLKRGVTKHRSTLYMPHHSIQSGSQIDIEVFKGILEHIEQSIAKDQNYLFPCEYLIITAEQLINKNSKVKTIDVLIEMITMLDKAGLNHLMLHFKMIDGQLISQDEIAKLAAVISQLSCMQIHFNECFDFKDMVRLERINQQVLNQSRVEADKKILQQVSHFVVNSTDIKEIIAIADTLNSAAISTRLDARRQAFDEEQIALPFAIKQPGLQRQHQVERKHQQQQQVSTQQAWQRDIAKNTQKEEVKCGFLYGDEKLNVITRDQVVAALTPTHPNHQKYQIKLGDKLCEYNYMGRNLLDLWDRITGYHDENKSFTENTLPFSLYQITQITSSALLQMTKFPYDFQYGINVLDPASGFAFSRDNGELFIDKQFKSQSPLAASMVETHYPKALSAEYYDDVTELYRDTLAQNVYVELTVMVGQSNAWRLYSRFFDVLIHFEFFPAIDSVAVIKKRTKLQSTQLIYGLEYLFSIYQHYHEIMQKMQAKPNHYHHADFEAALRHKFSYSQLTNYENNLCTLLDKADRELIFKLAVEVMQSCDFKQINLSQLNQRLEKFLIALLKRGNAPTVSQTNQQYSAILKELTSTNLLAFIQTINSNGAVAGCILFDIFFKIYQKQGKDGFIQFKKAFLDPLCTFEELLTPQAITQLLTLLKFTDKELNWWQTLSCQHVALSGYGNFSDLFNGFSHFIAELKEKNLYELLPTHCPLQDVAHLKIGLKRLLTILNNAIDAKEQLLHLEGISLNVMDAVYAAHMKNYFIVTKKMHLNIKEEVKFVKFIQESRSYSRTDSIYDNHMAQPFMVGTEKITDYARAYQIAVTCFYRYLAMQKYIKSIDDYQDYVSHIQIPPYWHLASSLCHNIYNSKESISYDEPESHHFNAKLKLLSIIAYSTTGKRNMEDVPATASARIMHLNTFIESILQIVRYRTGDIKWQKWANNLVEYSNLDHLLNQLKDIGGFELKPSLTELTYILQLIHKTYERNYADSEKSAAKSSAPLVVDNELLWRRDNQCLYSLEYIKRYYLDFLRAMVILHDKNQQTDYAYFLKFIKIMVDRNFSPQLTGRIIRLLSLIKLTAATSIQELEGVNKFITEISNLNKSKTEDAVSLFLAVLSRLNFQSNTTIPLSFAQINHFVKKCVSECGKTPMHIFASELIKNNYFDGFILDADDIQDAQFYVDEMSLDKAYPGLGQYYQDIKNLLLVQFTMDNPHQRKISWDVFLENMQQLLMRYSTGVRNLINVLMQKSWQDCRITGVNKILISLSNASKNYQSLPYELLAELNTSFVNKCDANDNLFLPFFDQWLNCMEAPLTIYSKKKILRLASLLANDAEGYKWLEMIEKLYLLITAVTKNQQHLEEFFERLVYSLAIIQKKKLGLQQFSLLVITIGRIYSHILDTQQFHLVRVALDMLWNFQNYPEVYTDLIRVQGLPSFLDIAFILSHTVIDDLKLLGDSVKYLAQLSAPHITLLASLYHAAPYPEAGRLIDLMQKRCTLDEFIKQHITDPHNHRDEKILQQQFESGHVNPYIKRIQFLDEEIDLSDLSEELYMWFIIINTIGKDHVRFMTMEQIKKCLHGFREQFTNGALHPADYNYLPTLLITVAVTREAIYRCSNANAPMWPSPIQMLAALCHINNMINQSKPLFFKAATGEGKSLITFITAIFSWTKGGAVNLVKHKSNLAYRDYELFKQASDALNIPSAFITAHSKAEDYNANGLHYVEFMDCALFRQSVMLEKGKDLHQLHMPNNKTNRLSFIVDEADQIILHYDIDCNLTTSREENANIHPYSWVFDFLIDYLQDNKHNVTEANKATQFFTVKVGHIQKQLSEKYPQFKEDIYSVEFRAKLNTWIRSAWTAIRFKEKDNYLIKTKEVKINGAVHTEGYAALIIHDNRMPANVTYSEAVQQCLHTLLNKQFALQKNPIYFNVDTEQSIYSTMNHKAVLNWMQSLGGDFIMMSATTGAPAERAEMRGLYDFRFIKLPKRERSTRVIKPDYFCADREKQFSMIIHWCDQYTNVNRAPHKRHAILIPVESIEKAEALTKSIRDDPKTKKANITLLHADIDIEDDQIAALEAKAAESGHITIATSGFIQRGFDPQPPRGARHQIVVLHTFLQSDAATKQEGGRGARIDKYTGKRRPGKSFGIYNRAEEIQRHGTELVKIEDAYQHPEKFKAMQYLADYQKEAAQRIFRQIESEVFNHMQSSFNAIWVLCKLINDELIDEQQQLKKADFAANLAQFKQFQEEMLNAYSSCLSQLLSIKPSLRDTTVLFIMNVKNKVTDEDFWRIIKPFNDYVLTEWLKFLADQLNKLSKISLVTHEKLNKLTVLFTPKLAMENHVITAAQTKIILARKAGQKAGDDDIQFRIYEKWKEGLNVRAYINPGKQSIFSAFASSVSEKLFLPTEYKELLIANRNKYKESRYLKMQKRWQFSILALSYLGLSPVCEHKKQTLMVKIAELLPRLTIKSEQLLAQQISQEGDINADKILVEEGSVTIHFAKTYMISFTCNPCTQGYKILLKTGHKVLLNVSEKEVIKELEQIIIKALTEKCYTGELPVKVKSIPFANGQNGVSIEIDFTGKSFRHLDRAEFLFSIASQLKIFATMRRDIQLQIQKSLNFPVPDVTVQIKLINDLKLKAGTEALNIIPAIQQFDLNKCSADQVTMSFKQIINAVKEYKKGFWSSNKIIIINALEHYATGYQYQDEKNRPANAVIKPFTNLAELVMNHHKRFLVAQISDLIHNSLDAKDLLTQLLKECFFELLHNIIDAPAATNFGDIYQAWLKSCIKYNNEEVSYSTLVKKNKVCDSFYKNVNGELMHEQLLVIISDVGNENRVAFS